MLFKLLNLNSNLALTLGYLNLALNNSALVFCKWYYSNPFRFSETFSSPVHYFPTNDKLLWKGSNPGGRGERGLICEASILFWREIGSPPKLGRWHSLEVSNGGSNGTTNNDKNNKYFRLYFECKKEHVKWTSRQIMAFRKICKVRSAEGNIINSQTRILEGLYAPYF